MQTEPKQMDALALAFLGDAVYELYIREHVLARGLVRADRLHKECVRYVKATAFEALLGYLRASGREDRLAEIARKAAELTEAAEGGEDA